MLRLLIFPLAVLFFVTGCCSTCYTSRVNCNDTLVCDIQRLLAIDEFSVTYMRNTVECIKTAEPPASKE